MFPNKQDSYLYPQEQQQLLAHPHHHRHDDCPLGENYDAVRTNDDNNENNDEGAISIDMVTASQQNQTVVVGGRKEKEEEEHDDDDKARSTIPTNNNNNDSRRDESGFRWRKFHDDKSSNKHNTGMDGNVSKQQSDVVGGDCGSRSSSSICKKKIIANTVIIDDDDKRLSTFSRRSDGATPTNIICQSQQQQKQEEEEEDEVMAKQMIYEAVSNAGKKSFGIVAIEVWTFDESSSELHRPRGGYWRSPLFHPKNADALERIENPDHPNYEKPASLLPGLGLAGILWSDSRRVSANRMSVDEGSDNGNANNWVRLNNGMIRSQDGNTFVATRRRHHRPSRRRSTGILHGISQSLLRTASSSCEDENTTRRQWLDVCSLVNDPDQTPEPRMALFEQAGLGQALGVQFNIRGQRGIVLYLARSTADSKQLASPVYHRFLLSAADHIGVVCALVQPQLQCCRAKKTLVKKRASSALLKLEAVRSFALPLVKKEYRVVSNIPFWNAKNAYSDSPSRFFPSSWKYSLTTLTTCFNRRTEMIIKKSRGGSMQPPAPMPFVQSLWSFCGVFITLFILTCFSNWTLHISNEKDGIIFGPVGALMTLQYGLTAAPAAQPRNIMYGQLVAGIIALLFTYIPDTMIPPLIRISVATATAIAVMGKLGLTHPPGGGLAIVLSSGKYSWIHLLLVCVGNIISILTATVINNMSERRQYPTYWEMGIS